MNELLVALCAGLLMAFGLFLLTDRHPFRRILGFSCMGHAVNLTLFEAGNVNGIPAFVNPDGTLPVNPELMASPIPQSLVLTAIVIGLAIVTLLAVIGFRHNQR